MISERALKKENGPMKNRFRINPLSQDFYAACDKFLGNPDWAVFLTAKDKPTIPQDNIQLSKPHEPIYMEFRIQKHPDHGALSARHLD